VIDDPVLELCSSIRSRCRWERLTDWKFYHKWLLLRRARRSKILLKKQAIRSFKIDSFLSELRTTAETLLSKSARAPALCNGFLSLAAPKRNPAAASCGSHRELHYALLL
jgi:hypothetical protein